MTNEINIQDTDEYPDVWASASEEISNISDELLSSMKSVKARGSKPNAYTADKNHG